MKRITLLVACSGMLLGAGCEKKDQDAAMAQGQAVVQGAEDLAGKAWKSASDVASKLTPDSGRKALAGAESQMESLKGKLSNLKAPSELDKLKLDSVDSQIDRLKAAINLNGLKADLDEKVKTAMQAKDNATKSVESVKAELDKADAEYRDLQDKVTQAQKVYDDASAKVKEASKKVQDAAGSVGL